MAYDHTSDISKSHFFRLVGLARVKLIVQIKYTMNTTSGSISGRPRTPRNLVPVNFTVTGQCC